jgi:Putative Actinobacterial Holin-X, holin superfamily III
MANQASVNRSNGSDYHASPLTMASNIADFGSDLSTLVELQAKLAAIDAKDCAARATTPLILTAGGLVLAVGSLPVILIGLAGLIAANANLSAGMAQLIVGLAALVTAGVVSFVGLKRTLSSLDSFQRSRRELVRNFSWLRTVLASSDRNAKKRRF